MAIDYTELFTILGKAFRVQEIDLAYRSTDLPGSIENLISAVEDASDFDATATIDGLTTLAGQQRGNQSLSTDIAERAKALLVDRVKADAPLPRDTASYAVAELIAQMIADNQSVDGSALSAAVTAGAGNRSDGTVRASVLDEQGRQAQHAYAERIRVRVQSATPPGQLLLEGEASATGYLRHDWPLGSGAAGAIAVTAPGGLLENGDFDDEREDVPDEWLVAVGTIGTTLKMTVYEVQTIAIASSPTEGVYYLLITDPDSNDYRTRSIPFDASAADLQVLIREIPGLESATVTAVGTSPNLTHTVTLNAAGNWGQFTSEETFDVGTITHGTTTGGSANAYRGRSLEFDGNGSEATAIYQIVTLQPRTVYAFNCKMKVDVFPAAGALAIRLRDLAGNVLDNLEGDAQSIAVNPQNGGDLVTSAWRNIGGFFQTPDVLPATVVLEIVATTAISNTSSVFIDDATLVQATRLYAGGPYVAAFDGKNALGPADVWDIAITHDRAGKFQEFFLRNGLTDPGVLLPFSGSETIDDILIS